MGVRDEPDSPKRDAGRVNREAEVQALLSVHPLDDTPSK